ncbi:dethiobiotin synthase [Halomonas sp. TRM85114]|uniref:dethiobiotin synthase n=1 Tax=Halomonas jincaotanensis TaxID=2810616 RepID=UPI001BD449A5|nr:dethiobiotin synthase [Halomonas jincaotanensis]MBS9403967.1 dethiobiotin synthase [Halomonas jincaotanensis]
MTRYFVTGTDTDAGKTLVASGMLALARRRGLTTLGLKPVASGCRRTAHGLRNDDALALQSHTWPALPYEAINPAALEPAIAPHLAAREAGICLTLDALVDPLAPLMAERRGFTLIEGAGGWRVPINDVQDLSGLAMRLELPVILVVGLKLGCINHARLSAEAIAADGLRLAGWVGNRLDDGFAQDASSHDPALHQANLDSLHHYLPAPCLGVVPRLMTAEAAVMAEAAADYLVLPDVD